MNIDKFKHQHVVILDGIAALRGLVQAGIAEHADDIAARIIAMSGTIKLHLAAEDRNLYPALEGSGDAALARLSRQFRVEMAGISLAYVAFAAQWNSARRLRDAPEQFRADANAVLRVLYERMKREDRDFYPAIETPRQARSA